MQPLLDRLTVPFLTVFFTITLFFLFTKAFGPIPFSVTSVTTNKSDLFTATGTGEVSATPTTAQFTLGITKNAAAADDAKNQANEIMNKITQDLKTLGIEEKDIKTTNFSVNPGFEPDRPGAKVFTASEDVTVKAKDIQTANQAIDIATKDGANVVGGATLSFDDADQEKLEDQARIEAIKKAKEKAARIAQAAGIRLGRIMNITESPSNQPMPLTGGVMMEKAATAAPTQLNPGENKVQVTVTLSYETL